MLIPYYATSSLLHYKSSPSSPIFLHITFLVPTILFKIVSNFSMALAAAAEAAPEVFAKDALIGWYRGEFAAANAIIDALMSHISQMNGGDGSEYEPLHAAIHQRRMNWIPVLQMQKFCSIADVVVELKRVEFNHSVNVSNGIDVRSERSAVSYKKSEDGSADSSGGADDLKVHCISDSGSQEEEVDTWDNTKLCTDHEACMIRRESIKAIKGFQAREPIKGHMVNVVKGLKLYEGIFSGPELIKLSEFVSDLRLAGHKGELSGETFIYFNKEMKGNKKEIVQLGVPVFQTANQDSTTKTEAIPPLIEDVIDHLVQWRLLPESRRPNSCIISFFDEEEYSHPYFKPPHIDTPISTLVLSETTFAFGRMLSCDPNGNYKGSLTLPLKEGSLIVMRGNSADNARHVVCPSKTKRVTISFVRVRPAINQPDPLITPMHTTTSMALWQPLPQQVQSIPMTEPVIAYASPQGMYPTWTPVAAYTRPPVAMWTPGPMIPSPGPNAKDGTGVFLPWNPAPKRYTKHLPPRIQKRRHMRYSN